MPRRRSKASLSSRRMCAFVAIVVATATLAIISTPAASAKMRRPTHRWDSRVEPIAHAVERIRGATFVTPVPVRFLSNHDFEKQVRGRFTGAGGAFGGGDSLRTLAL